jgi:hypothetical protein
MGNGLTVTVWLWEALQPLALLAVTVYVPPSEMVMDAVVARFDQRYADPPEAVSVTEPPSQNVVGPSGVIWATGSGLTVTVWLWEAMQPLALVAVTVYEPPDETVMSDVVARFDQR